MSTSLNEQLAAELYESYRMKVGGKAFDGSPLPKFNELVADPKKRTVLDGWITVAQTARTKIAQEISVGGR